MNRLSRPRYERLLPPLRDRLLDAQFALRTEATRALAIIVTGVPAAGRSESIARLLEWLDPKFVEVHARDPSGPEVPGRPRFWRYWRDLPAKGRISVWFGGWYEEWLHASCRRRLPSDRRMAASVRRLEAMLAAEGIGLLKIHLHVPRDVQRKRLGKLARNPLTRWRVTAEDRWLVRHAKRVDETFRRIHRTTDHPAARWVRVEGSDAEFRSLAFGRLVVQALERQLQPGRRPVPRRAGLPGARGEHAVHGQALRSRSPLPDLGYDEALLTLQGRLAGLARRKAFLDRGAVLVFEGMDAAGKGGAIRRLVHALDVRQYRIIPVSAPTATERQYPWLWRFWQPLPGRGDCVIFDRSWYGRVLVERVRGFASHDDVHRAFEEIREFERQLLEHGLVIAKFWLDVSPDAQLQRFRERNRNALKRFKVDREDWVNRRYFADYQAATREMIRRTGQAGARWVAVNADDKQVARLVVLDETCRAIERALD